MFHPLTEIRERDGVSVPNRPAFTLFLGDSADGRRDIRDA
jgi:hypothetical protein